jgi:hypothetical protein
MFIFIEVSYDTSGSTFVQRTRVNMHIYRIFMFIFIEVSYDTSGSTFVQRTRVNMHIYLTKVLYFRTSLYNVYRDPQ